MTQVPVIKVSDEDKDGDNRINQSTASTFEEVVKIDQFATQIYNWHVELTNQMKHVLNMPRMEDGGLIAIVVYDPSHPNSHGHGSTGETDIADLVDEQGIKIPVGWRKLTNIDEVNGFMHGVRYAFDLVADLPFKFLPTDADGNTVPEYAEGTEPNEEEAGPLN